MPPVAPPSSQVTTPPQVRDPSPSQNGDPSGLPSFLQTLSQRMDSPPPVAATPTASTQAKDGASVKPANKDGSAGGASSDATSKADTPTSGGTADAAGPAKTDSKPSSNSKDGKDGSSAANATNGTRSAEDPALAALLGAHAQAAQSDRVPESRASVPDSADAGIAAASGAGGTAAADSLGLATGTRTSTFQSALDAAASKEAAGAGVDRMLPASAAGEQAVADPLRALTAAAGADPATSATGTGDGRASPAPTGDSAPPPTVAALAPAIQATAGALPAATLKVEPRVGSAAFSEALGNRVVWMARNDTQSAELHLNPPDLGPLQVVVDVNRDQATAFFSSPHADVRQAIEDALPRLRDMFAQSGIQLGNASVGSDPRPQQEQTGGGTSRGRGDRLNSTAGASAGALRASRPLRVGAGLVDTFA